MYFSGKNKQIKDATWGSEELALTIWLSNILQERKDQKLITALVET